jgi:membrane protease YdiL (CAAX protease family)
MFIPNVIGEQGNIIEHTYMFLIAFFVTFLFQKIKGIDFGYRSFKIKDILKCVFTISVFYLSLSFIDALFGIKIAVNNDLIWWIIFQFFFSGLGEEIICRSIPIKVFDTVINGKEKVFHINKKIKIDLSVIMSSILFSIVHIPVYSNQALYSFIYALIVVFTGGVIYGVIYRKTKSVWSCMFIHGLANVIMATFPIISGILFGT